MALRGDATFFEVFANHPALFGWYIDRFYGEVFSGGLCDRRVKELLRLRLSSVHGCKFCNQGNRVDAAAAGLSPAEIDAIANGHNQQLPAADQAVLELAEQMQLTNPGGQLDRDLHGKLSAHFDDAQILELGLVAGVLAGMAKMMFVFDLVEKEDDCPLMPAKRSARPASPMEDADDPA